MEKRGIVVGAASAVLVAGVVFGGMAMATAAPQTVAPQVGRYSTAESAVPLSAASEYVATIRGLVASRDHAEQTDAEIIKAGRDLCAEIKAGATWDTFTEQMNAYPGSIKPSDFSFYRTVIRSAVFAFCPADAGVLR